MNSLMSSYLNIFIIAIQMIFGVIFVIFTFCMLKDQWTIIQNDTTCKILNFLFFSNRYETKNVFRKGKYLN